ncbi:MAG: FHA domain-containing protein [Gemmatimonadaceae bacterium]
MTDTKTPGTPYLIHAFEHKAYGFPEERPLCIGRETTCDVIVNEVAVSRHHAEVRHEGDDFVLYPVGSTTTVMNGLPVIAPQPLHEQSMFMVGSMKFIFTKERLPVAMKIATATSRQSSVDDRRPTLTFPGQPNAPEIQQPSDGLTKMIPIIAIVIAAMLGGAAYWAYSLR